MKEVLLLQPHADEETEARQAKWQNLHSNSSGVAGPDTYDHNSIVCW